MIQQRDGLKFVLNNLLLGLFVLLISYSLTWAETDNPYNYLNYTNAPKASSAVVKPLQSSIKTSTVKTINAAENTDINNVVNTPSKLEANISVGNETYLVIPVLSTTSSMNAYGDLVNLVANDFAVHLRELSHTTHVPYSIVQPSEAQRSIQRLGLNGVYQDMVSDFRQSRRPDPSKVDFFVDKYAETGNNITGIVFVEATFDPIGTTALNKQIKSPIMRILDVSSIFNMPESLDVNYMVDATATLFGTGSGNSHMLWQGQATSKLPLQSIGVFQSSIYSTDSTLNRFSVTSQGLSQNLISTFPGLNHVKNKASETASTGANGNGQNLQQVIAKVKGWVQGE